MRATSPCPKVDAAREPPCGHSLKGCTHDCPSRTRIRFRRALRRHCHRPVRTRIAAVALDSSASGSDPLAMVRDAGPARNAGLAGLATGVLPGVAVIAAGAHMTETVVVGILLVQAIWNLIAAAWLLRGAKPGKHTFRVDTPSARTLPN